MIPHNPSCIKCGRTLADWELKKKNEQTGELLVRQICFDCRNPREKRASQ